MVLLLSLFVTCPAAAWAAPNMTVRIVNYGVYSETAPGGFLEFKNKTQNVPGRLGTLFGVQFEVTGLEGKAPLDVQIRLNHPSYRDPTGGPSTTQDNWNVRVKPGEPSFAGFVFDAKWKIVPGVWTFEFLYKSVKLADHSFQVVAVKDAGQATPLGKASLNSSQVAQTVMAGKPDQKDQKPEDIPTVPPLPEDADEAPKAFKEVSREEARREEAKALEKAKRRPEPESPAAAQPPAAPSLPAPPERWTTQAVFQSRENADALARKLREAGFPAAGVYQAQEGGKTMYAAYSGTYESEASARQAADAFEKKLNFRPVVKRADPAQLALAPTVSSAPATSPAAPPAAAKAAAEVVPPPPAADQAPAGDRLYVVKVGSFAQEENAQNFSRELAAKGWKAQVQRRTDAKGNALHVVTLGAFKDVKEALRLSGDYQGREKKDAMVLAIRPETDGAAPPAPQPAQTVAPVQAAAAPAAAVPARPGPDAAAKTVYYVQISEHQNETEASENLGGLRDKGYGPCLLRDKEAKRFAVIFGPYADKIQAEREAQNFNEMELRKSTVRFLDRDAFNAKATCK